jgi:hypothetical protein
MDDWTQDPDVVQARSNFDERRREWLAIAPPDRRLPAHPTPSQRAAFDRMRLADCAYTQARDIALELFPRLMPEGLPAARTPGPEVASG